MCKAKQNANILSQVYGHTYKTLPLGYAVSFLCNFMATMLLFSINLASKFVGYYNLSIFSKC